jgi:hypothetical protein
MDKFEKLKKFDLQTLNEFLNFGYPKIIPLIKSLDELRNEQESNF